MGVSDNQGEQGQASNLQRARILQLILAECEDSARLLELFYFSREPGMLEVIRALVAMPEQTRASIEAFLTMANEPTAISATWDASGRLTLNAPQVGQAVAIIRHCVANEDSDTPPLPN